MAKCPNCNNKVNFWSTIFLSRLSNRVLCGNCNTVLEGEKSFLSFYGVFSTVAFLLVARNANKWIGSENLFLGFGLGFFTFLLIMIIFYARIRLKVSDDQDITDLIPDKTVKPPELPDDYSRTDFLKHKFYNKSDSELDFILTDKDRVPEARQAAKELLNERKNVT